MEVLILQLDIPVNQVPQMMIQKVVILLVRHLLNIPMMVEVLIIL